MGSVMHGLIAAANQDPRLARVFSTFTATQPVALPRHRPRQGAGARASTSATCSPRCRRRSAASTSTISTSTAAPGRSTSRARRSDRARHRRHLADLRAQQARRRWCRCARSPTLRIVRRAAGDHALQQLPRDHRSRAARRPASRPARRSPPWRRSRPRRCRPATATNGPAPPTRSTQATGQTGVDPRRSRSCSPICSWSALYESWVIPVPVLLSVTVGVFGAFVGIIDRRAGARPLRPDRPRRADRAGGQERHPDRRVRQGAARGGRAASSRPRSLGARMRFRAVMMTSIAFVLGLVPLVDRPGAAQISRRDVGTPVFAGMIAASARSASS